MASAGFFPVQCVPDHQSCQQQKVLQMQSLFQFLVYGFVTARYAGFLAKAFAENFQTVKCFSQPLGRPYDSCVFPHQLAELAVQIVHRRASSYLHQITDPLFYFFRGLYKSRMCHFGKQLSDLC